MVSWTRHTASFYALSMMNGQAVRILVDFGAERNLVRPGLGLHLIESSKVIAERFDGIKTR
uniref:Uncharacterized protein n=1 Tax=Hyaloperonospora arabidopsidis (strain Emoy2) TaxID=559515 RepID=M4C0P6_HYAAE